MMELFFLFFAAFGSVIFLYIAYLGYFNPIRFERNSLPVSTAALLPFVGSYKDAVAKQLELFKLMQEAGLKSNKSCGIYLDDPKQVPAERLRSMVGMIVAKDEVEEFNALNSGAKLVNFEPEATLSTTFAYKSGISILLAINKIYGAYEKYLKRVGKARSSAIEIYDFERKKLFFYFPDQSKEQLWETLQKSE